MPPPSRPSGRRTLWILAVVAIAGGAALFLRLGTLLHENDPLQRADAIHVLAGSRMERALEGADLYQEGYAPLIILTVEQPDNGQRALMRRGVPFQSSAELARDSLLKIGIPASAFFLPAKQHDNTADEADSVRRLALERKWKRIIVVTSVFHTRRAGFAMRRALKGTGIDVIMRSTRYDAADPVRWWRSRNGIRVVMGEAPKFFAYLLGLSA